MKTLIKTAFPLFLTVLISIFLSQDVVKTCFQEKGKMENTENGSGSRGICSLETAAEEEVSVLPQYYSEQRLHTGDINLSPLLSDLPPQLYYSIWLPPDNS